MRRVFLLFVVLTLAFPFLAGCGGEGPPPSKEEQEQQLQETEAAMERGMEAMKEDMKKKP